MARAVEEWIGKTDDTRAPPRNQRKLPNIPWTLQAMKDRCRVDEDTGCWLWQHAIAHGYGVLRYEGKTIRTHRLSFSLAHGVMPPSSIDVCHSCDVRNCINPEHLFTGTRQVNMADCVQKGRFKFLPVLEGDASPNSKLTTDQVRSIRKDGRSGRAIARAYGVDKGTISAILKRKTWRSV